MQVQLVVLLVQQAAVGEAVQQAKQFAMVLLNN
jgi:hypothetical protein